MGLVVGGVEVEIVGGLGGGKRGVGGLRSEPNRRRASSHGVNPADDRDEADDSDDEGMDVN